MAFNFSQIEVTRSTPMLSKVPAVLSTVPPPSAEDDLSSAQEKLGPKSVVSLRFDQDKACLRQRLLR